MRLLPGIAAVTGVIVFLLMSTTTVGRSAVLQSVQIRELTRSDSVSVSPEQRFKLLRDSLQDLSKDYAIDVLKTVGSLLLVIGWLVMSEGSREFLRQNQTAWRTALVAIPVVAATNTVWLVDRFWASDRKVELLDGLGYLGKDYYKTDGITWVVMGADTILHLALFAVLFGLVYSQRGARSDSK